MQRGVLFMIASALAFSAMSMLVKVAGERLPSQEIVVARALDSGLVVHVVGGEAFEPSTNPQDPEALEDAPQSGARMQ